MIKRIVRNLRGIKDAFREIFVRRSFKQCSTLIGTGHKFYSSAGIMLSWGSTKEDIILHNNCEVYGSLLSVNRGKIIMHESSKIGYNSSITAVNRVEIGKDTAISYYVTIIDNNNHPVNPDDRRYMRHTPHGSIERSPHMSANAPIIIGENVLVGAYSRICKGVTIGDNAIIAANSVVTHDVPANAIAAGNPAKIVKENIDQTTTPIFPLKK